VNVWVERLTMAIKVRDLNDDKLFKIAKLNGSRNLIRYQHIGLF